MTTALLIGCEARDAHQLAHGRDLLRHAQVMLQHGLDLRKAILLVEKTLKVVDGKDSSE